MTDPDIVVIGAGPAGSAAACFLARAGFRVQVYEKAVFPRFQIGESLLPTCVPVLRELGLDLDTAPYAIKKEGVRFVDGKGERHFRVAFNTTLSNCFPHAYEVDRAEFDQDLAERAMDAGAEIHFNTTVSSWEEFEDHVVVQVGKQQVRCRYLIDAGGQQAPGGRQSGMRIPIDKLGKCATFSHYREATAPRCDDIFKTGDITILLRENSSWGWIIPLPRRRLSVGVITRNDEAICSPEDTFQAFLENNPVLGTMLEGAVRDAPIRRRANFSFAVKHPGTRRTVFLGDAQGFLDPVFSSGVTFALLMAQKFAAVAIPTMQGDGALELEGFFTDVRRGYRTFEQIIQRFYRPGWAERTFFFVNKPEDQVRQINTLLAGDVWRHDNPFQEMLLASRREPSLFRD